MRIVCAEACGWTKTTKTGWGFSAPLDYPAYKKGNGESVFISQLPNYPEDLNAMREAEELIAKSNWVLYLNSLIQIVCRDFDEPFNLDQETIFCLVKAAASQRLEAFCRTVKPEMFQSKIGGSNE